MLIQDEAFIAPGVIVLPNVTIGHGVVNAGSVVTRVAPLPMVQGNLATPAARCEVPLGMATPLKEFSRQLKSLRNREPARGS